MLTGMPLAKPEPAADFDQVYEEHFAFVWKSLRRLGVPPASIDDAAQDVFVVVHRKLETFEGRSSLKTWLFGIAHLIALGYRKRSAAPQTETGPDALASPDAGPLERAAASEAMRFVERFLDSLDDVKRPVFILAEFEQLSAPEIAEALGVNINTVYSRLRAVRQAFQLAVHQRRQEEP
jgi:RNA polymerase sigma-70 factor (ECF subfamily)